MKDCHLLWITPKWPLPPHDGARRATCVLIKGLTQQGVRISLLSYLTNHDNPDQTQIKEELGVQEALTTQRKYTEHTAMQKLGALSHSFLSNPALPLTMRHFNTSLDTSGSYSAVVYDGLHTAAHASSNGVFVPDSELPVIYRSHNRESQIWYRKAQMSSGIKRLLLQQQAGKVKIFEDSLVRKCAALATVSEADLLLFEKDESAGVARGVVPIGFDFVKPAPRQDSEQLKLLYVGKMDWRPNKEGLLWFLKEVWPRLLSARENIALDVVGSGDPGVLTPYLSQSKVTFHGRVDSLQPYYESCHLALVPIFYGSGTRVKVIEAARYGRAVISTTIGVEGIPLGSKDFVKAETVSEWVTALKDLSPSVAIDYGTQAFEKLKASYHYMSAARKFIKLLGQAGLT